MIALQQWISDAYEHRNDVKGGFPSRNSNRELRKFTAGVSEGRTWNVLAKTGELWERLTASFQWISNSKSPSARQEHLLSSWRPRTLTTPPTETVPAWCTASWRASPTSPSTPRPVTIYRTHKLWLSQTFSHTKIINHQPVAGHSFQLLMWF